mgnify:CR=1 FL=1
MQHADHAVLEVDTPEGPYSLPTEWLVAADGARSAIRSLLDLKLEGASYEGRFVIADIRIDLPLPTERRISVRNCFDILKISLVSGDPARAVPDHPSRLSVVTLWGA